MPSAVENGNRRKGNCVEQWSSAAEPLISRINRRSPGENRVRLSQFGERTCLAQGQAELHTQAHHAVRLVQAIVQRQV